VATGVGFWCFVMMSQRASVHGSCPTQRSSSHFGFCFRSSTARPA
jgi:hypothetical protein